MSVPADYSGVSSSSDIASLNRASPFHPSINDHRYYSDNDNKDESATDYDVNLTESDTSANNPAIGAEAVGNSEVGGVSASNAFVSLPNLNLPSMEISGIDDGLDNPNDDGRVILDASLLSYATDFDVNTGTNVNATHATLLDASPATYVTVVSGSDSRHSINEPILPSQNDREATVNLSDEEILVKDESSGIKVTVRRVPPSTASSSDILVSKEKQTCDNLQSNAALPLDQSLDGPGRLIDLNVDSRHITLSDGERVSFLDSFKEDKVEDQVVGR